MTSFIHDRDERNWDRGADEKLDTGDEFLLGSSEMGDIARSQQRQLSPAELILTSSEPLYTSHLAWVANVLTRPQKAWTD